MMEMAAMVLVSHRNGFRAEYSGRNLAEYSAETVSVKIMGFGDERNNGMQLRFQRQI